MVDFSVLIYGEGFVEALRRISAHQSCPGCSAVGAFWAKPAESPVI